MRVSAISSRDSTIKSSIIDFLRFQVQFSKVLFLRNNFYLRIFSRKPWVMRRTACLGNDVFEILEHLPKRSLNIQKGRIDLLTKSFHGRLGIMKLYKSRKFIERADIRSLVIRQSISQLKKLNPPQIIIIDSYSELTDQEFLLPNKANIYCNFSDLRPNKDLLVQSNGLLDLGSLDDYYETFLMSVIEKWGGVPLIFLHFPEYKEPREKFRERSKMIRDSALRTSHKYANFHFVELDEIEFWQLHKPNADEFPYHYNHEVKKAFADKVDAILLDSA